MIAPARAAATLLVGAATLAFASRARAQVIAAEPVAPIAARAPGGAPQLEVQIVLQVVVDAGGRVESAVEVARAPSHAPDAFAAAAIDAVKAATFTPSSRDGRPFRARIEHVVVFASPPPAAKDAELATSGAQPPRTASPVSIDAQDEDYVVVRGKGWPSPRGIGDVRVDRALLEASPRQTTSEMLSAAPGFFVDHEDGEGIGNDVYLRGFDLEHGSGIEMRLGSIPINIPTHIRGQGYADANFIIPETVRSIRVLQGPYDPRQGDAAIVGSAYFDLGIPTRGYQLKGSYGSFGQARVVAVAAPADANDETFAAFSLRKSHGFGVNRASQSGSAIAQYGLDLGSSAHLRVTATAYGARAALPGVAREDDVAAGRISYYGQYPYYAGGQGVESSRVILGADFDHVTPGGARFEIAPWFMWTTFRARQNFTGNVETSQESPAYSGLGDTFETTNSETAAGVTSRLHAAKIALGSVGELVIEPGVTARAGRTKQAKSLLEGERLAVWDRRTDARLSTLDVGAYVDADVRLWDRLRVSGGVRADLIMAATDDALANRARGGAALPGEQRSAAGALASPRVTVDFALTPWLSPVISYGEGFRSLPAERLVEGMSRPYSKVQSGEVGVRVHALRDRYIATVVGFHTWVGNELVFAAEAGGLETESASRRTGLQASLVAKPQAWLLVSTALSITRARFQTLVAGVSHDVPSVPPVVLRLDATARGALIRIRDTRVIGRVGLGYTFLSGRPLTDTVRSAPYHAVNAGAGVRYAGVELGVDAYNLLGLRYADEAAVYISNWSDRSGQQSASIGTHVTAAPPRTVLGTATLYF